MTKERTFYNPIGTSAFYLVAVVVVFVALLIVMVVRNLLPVFSAVTIELKRRHFGNHEMCSKVIIETLWRLP